MTGRPSKFTDETKSRIIEGIKLGATYELAAGYGGVSYATFRQWMIRGEKVAGRLDRAKKEIEISAEDLAFLHFFEAVKSAEAEGAVTWLTKIEDAAKSGNWQAAAWKLERRYPAEYGRSIVDHNLDFRNMSDDELRAIAEGKSSRGT